MPRIDASKWSAPKCLRWLAKTTRCINYRYRADDWKGEISRFAKYMGQSEREYNREATRELRLEVQALSARR